MKTVYNFLLVIIIILSNFSTIKAQKADRSVYDYIRFYKKQKDSISYKNEILLVGTFHFRKEFTVSNVKEQIMNFNPNMIFIEEVPFDAADKVKYMDYLYLWYGDNIYSSAMDSAINFTGFSFKKAVSNTSDPEAYLSIYPNNIQLHLNLINSLFIIHDEPNAFLRLYQMEKTNAEYDSLVQYVSPMHLKYKFCSKETRFLSIPIAFQLGLQSIESMDYHYNRKQNDSLLSIASRKLVPRVLLRPWKIPYMIKMMSIDKKGPKNEKDAIKHFKVLNKWKSFKNMARLHDKYLNNSKVEASLEWNKNFKTRNRKMTERIVSRMHETQSNKAAIIVGASHVPYILYELHKQSPETKVTFLDISTL